jgi:hypothetical protein
MELKNKNEYKSEDSELNIFLPSNKSSSESDTTNYKKKSSNEEANIVMQGKSQRRG